MANGFGNVRGQFGSDQVNEKTQFALTGSDYFALTVLAFIAVGGASAYVHISNQALQNKLQGELSVVSTEIRADLASISDTIERSASEMRGVVNSALEARSDEVLLALTRLSDTPSGITVTVSNIDRGSQAVEAIGSFGANFGQTTRMFEVLDKVHFEVFIDDVSDPSAVAFQEVIRDLPANEWTAASVKIAPREVSELDERIQSIINDRMLEEISEELENLGLDGLIGD